MPYKIAIILLLLITSRSYAQTDKNRIDNELLIQIEEATLDLFKNQDIITKQLSKSPNIWQLIYPHATAAQTAKKQLESNSRIQYVQYNHYLEWRTTPNDPRYTAGLQWNLDLIGATTAWDYTTGGFSPNGDTIVVAVIDNGCDIHHEDLAENIWYNHTEIPNNGIDDDGNGWVDDYRGWNPIHDNDNHALEVHGTSVTSIIGAQGNNNEGIAGINWAVKLMLITGDDVALTTEANAVEAYSYVLEARRRYRQSEGTEGAYVVATNASFGINAANAADYPIWCSLYELLGEEGILSIGATANAAINVDEVGDMPTTCPSDYFIAVTQTLENDVLHSSAAYGVEHIDIGAPGAVFAARPNDTYNLFGGTSGAAPHLTGAVALLYAYPNELWGQMQEEDPRAAALLIKNIVLETAAPVEDLKGKSQSGGRLDLGRAMEQLDEYFSTPSTTDILAIFPNPATTDIFIKLSLSEPKSYQLQIIDALGRVVLNETITEERARIFNYPISTESWAKGVYFVRLFSDKEQYTSRFIKG